MLDPCTQNAANTGREKARLLLLEEGAGDRKEKKTTQGAAQQKPFLLSVTHLGAFPRDGPVPGGEESTNFRPLRCAFLIMAPSLWAKQVPNSQVPVWAPDVPTEPTVHCG